MAQVSSLHLPNNKAEDGSAEFNPQSGFVSLDFFSSDLNFPLNDTVSNFSVADFHFLDRHNQVTFVMDLLHQFVEESESDPGFDPTVGLIEPVDEMSLNNLEINPGFDPNFGVIEPNDEMGLDFDSSFGVIEGNGEMGVNNLEVDPGFDPSFEGNEEMGLGNLEVDLGLGVDSEDGFMVADCGDEFFVSRRGFDDGVSVSDSGDSCDLRVHEEGLDDFDLGMENEDGIYDGNEDDESLSGVRILFDSIRLVDDDDSGGNVVNENNGEFEWEEIDGVVNEREVMSLFFESEIDDDASVVGISGGGGGGERDTVTMANVEWEVLLNVRDFEASGGLGNEEDEEEDVAEYEVLFGQFAENESVYAGRPPASRSVVEGLEVVILSCEDVEDGNAVCAVCKDEMNVGERVYRLVCCHRYHGDCIVPWLGIRNTCPVCRFELPTDDPQYERRRSQRAEL